MLGKAQDTWHECLNSDWTTVSSSSSCPVLEVYLSLTKCLCLYCNHVSAQFIVSNTWTWSPSRGALWTPLSTDISWHHEDRLEGTSLACPGLCQHPSKITSLKAIKLPPLVITMLSINSGNTLGHSMRAHNFVSTACPALAHTPPWWWCQSLREPWFCATHYGNPIITIILLTPY